jgi:uncharacterized membrane protein YfhO
MISTRLNLVAMIGSIILLLIILELVRRKYLRERYALIWIVTGSLFLLLSIRVHLLYRISNFLGFTVPSNALFFFGILFLLSIVLGLSVITSRLSEKNKVLTQEVVLLKKRVADLEKSHYTGNAGL